MIKIRKAEERGHANYGWLDTHYTFSFANYFDPHHVGFRSLRVINDDTIAGGGGFDTHPHRDLEIITYVVRGVLQHRDSASHSAVIKPGDVQRISAGAGIEHSEFNPSPTEPVRLLQIWLLPERKGLKPDYAQKSFGDAHAGALTLFASKSGRDDSIPINQDADLFLGRLNPGDRVAHRLKPLRHAWVQVVEGQITLNGQPLKTGDGAAISEETALEAAAVQPSQFLVFDLS